MTAHSAIFLHLGLHKTGTSFLQNEVFPRWPGVAYVRPPLLDNLVTLVPASPRVLISREDLFGPIWARGQERRDAIAWVRRLFPEARPLLSFRRHDRYLVSAYKQYLQRGGPLPFRDFFDLAGDRGVLERDALRFAARVELVADAFGRPPFVFLHEELRADLGGLLEDLGRYFGTPAPAPGEIRRRTHNRSVTYYPAKLLRWLNGWNRSELNPDGLLALDNRYTRRLLLDPRSICQRWLAWVPDRPMLPASYLEEVAAYYAEDWAEVVALRDRRGELAPEA
jgi:hypothetical protein